MKTLRVVIACGCLIMSSSIAAWAQSVQTDYDRSYNLAKLRTYSFAEQTRPPGDPLTLSPLNDRRIHSSGEINPKNLGRDVNKSIAKPVQRFVKAQAAKK